MTPTEARDLLSRHDQYVKILSRKTTLQLRNQYQREANPIFGGPVRKDELISALADLAFPLEQANAARVIAYGG
jgi:hypothetical protein